MNLTKHLKKLAIQHVLRLENEHNRTNATYSVSPFTFGGLMNTYEAYVRAGGFVVKTRVVADNSQDAYFLLQGQYGKDNVVHLPTQVY